MRTTQLSVLALIGTALAAPVQVEERDVVTQSVVEWTTTTSWSTKIVWETGLPSDVAAAGFEGDERPSGYSKPHHKVHTPVSLPAKTSSAYTPPASTPAAPETPSSTYTPPPPAPTTSSSVYVAPKPTTTYTPPPAPTTTSKAAPPPAPTTSAYVAPTTSAAPAPSPSSESSGASAGASSSSSSSSSYGSGSGTAGSPFTAEGTYYSTGMGSCGIESSDSEAVVAVGEAFMSKYNGGNPNANPQCGKSITISYKGVTKTAKIVDTCPGCVNPEDLDMSPSLFQSFASESEGRLYGMKWWFSG